jgi:hypothetical protein
MSVVKFPGQAKRRPFAVAAFDPKREKMLLRAERIVELLSSRAIRDGWSFDKNRAARFLLRLPALLIGKTLRITPIPSTCD